MSIPKVFHISWYSATGVAAYAMECSCIGNRLKTTEEKIVAYIPRILVALPVLMVCAAVDLVAIAIKLPLFPLYCFFACECRCDILADLVSTIAFPIILLGHLLIGKIPESRRPSESIFRTGKDPVKLTELVLRDAIFKKRMYTVKRILSALNDKERSEILNNPKDPYCEPSLLWLAMRSGDVEIARMLMGAGALLPTIEEDQTKLLIDARKHEDIITILRENNFGIPKDETYLLDLIVNYCNSLKGFKLLSSFPKFNPLLEITGNTAYNYMSQYLLLSCFNPELIPAMPLYTSDKPFNMFHIALMAGNIVLMEHLYNKYKEISIDRNEFSHFIQWLNSGAIGKDPIHFENRFIFAWKSACLLNKHCPENILQIKKQLFETVEKFSATELY